MTLLLIYLYICLLNIIEVGKIEEYNNVLSTVS
jgi:hypothetical protein